MKLLGDETMAGASTSPSQAEVDRMMTECVIVGVTVGWLPSSRQIETTQRMAMAQVVDAQDGAMALSRKLFSCSHPSLKALNKARGELDAVKNVWTIPMAAEVGRALGSDGQQTDAAPGGKASPGIRLLLRRDIEQFETLFRAAERKLHAAAAEVQAKMPEIRALEKKRLGSTYNEGDYPDEIASRIRVFGPTYSEFSITARLPKDVQERQIAAVRRQVDESVGLAITNLVGELTGAFDSLANQLGHRRRVGRASEIDAKYAEHAEADIAFESTLAGGIIQVGLKKEQESGRAEIVRLTFPTLGAMTAALKPDTVDGEASVRTQAIDKVQVWLENFDRVKGMLGSDGEEVGDRLTILRGKLDDLNRNGSILSRLKRDGHARATLGETLRKAMTDLAETAEVSRARRGRRFAV